MAAEPRRLGTLGGVGLIVACLLGSAALRLIDSGAAIAQEMAASETRAPQTVSPAETEGLLAAIRVREAQLSEQEARLDARQQELRVAEAKLAEQLAAFETAQSQLENTLALADNAAEKDIDRMTAVYEQMKAADAARIFARMDVTFASGLLVRLRPEIAAAILTGMEPDAAYAITLTIASRNSSVPTE